MKHPKFKSFTLLELLIVLILTGILMSLVSGIFYYLFVYHQQVERKALPVNRIHQLDYLLKRDIDKASKVLLENHVLECRNWRDTVVYTIESNYVIRAQNTVVDTISIKASIDKIVKAGIFLKSFELSVEDNQNRKISHYYEKIYGVSTYFELNENQLQ